MLKVKLPLLKVGIFAKGLMLKPGEIPSRAGHKQIESMLEIGPGKGSHYIEVKVPGSKLKTSADGPVTSGGKWQRILTELIEIDPTLWRRPPGRPAGR